MRDFIDTYLNEMNANTKWFTGNQGQQHLLSNIGQLFAAGVDTTAHTINWSIYYLSKFPEVQDKMRFEIDKAAGLRLPSLDDRYFIKN